MTGIRAHENDVGVGRGLIYHAPADIWRAFDRLPMAVRHALHEAIIPWDPCQADSEYKKARRCGMPVKSAANRVCDAIRNGNRTEIKDFAAQYPGGQSPHTAANATIQRYERTGQKRKQA